MARPTEYKDANGAYRNPFFPDAELTPDIFWAYFDPEVQKLREMGVDTADEAENRLASSIALVAAGYIVPFREVAAYGYDPVTTVGVCELNGFGWFPALGEPMVFPQGQGFPGIPFYDRDHPPVRSFPISLKAAAWPPKVPKPAAVVAAGAPRVAQSMGGGYYARGEGSTKYNTNEGDVVTENGKTFVAHVSPGGLIGTGWSCYFVEKK